MTKRKGFIFTAILAVAVLTVWLAMASSALASTNAKKITLTLGQSQTIKASGCTLHVTSNAAQSVVVKCTASFDAAPESASAAIILKPKQKAEFFNNGCDLVITKQKAQVVKVTCEQGAADFVIVAPGGQIGYGEAVSTISVGQTIEWDWQGSPHTVTSGVPGTPDNQFCSPNDTNCSSPVTSGVGARYRHTFTTAGTFKYFCQIHLSLMTATVQVNP